MAFGQPPFAKFGLLQRLQCITDDAYCIEFPASELPVLLIQVIEACLQRSVKERATIQQLLGHPFLTGQPQTIKKDDAVTVRRDQIKSLLERFRNFTTSSPTNAAFLDTDFWTERIFAEWLHDQQQQ